MEDGAVLIVSGIIDIREGDVLSAAERAGFETADRRVRDNWCAFALRRKTDA